MAISRLSRQRQNSGLRAWVALAILGLLLVGTTLALTRVGPRPPVTQQEIRQQALQDASARGMSRIEKISVSGATLGQLRPTVRCSLPETVQRSLLVTARFASYSPCDPATRVWVVELWGDYPPWVDEPARMIYTASGDFIRSESGP